MIVTATPMSLCPIANGHGWSGKFIKPCVQILALFRDYDMRWPRTTANALAWAGALNVSINLTAPEVRSAALLCNPPM